MRARIDPTFGQWGPPSATFRWALVIPRGSEEQRAAADDAVQNAQHDEDDQERKMEEPGRWNYAAYRRDDRLGDVDQDPVYRRESRIGMRREPREDGARDED